MNEGDPSAVASTTAVMQLPVERVKRWRFPRSAKSTDGVADGWQWRRRRRNAPSFPSSVPESPCGNRHGSANRRTLTPPIDHN